MDRSRGAVESLRRDQVISIISAGGRTMGNVHRGGGTVGDLGRLTFGMTAFLKTCNRSSVLNTGPVTGHLNTGGKREMGVDTYHQTLSIQATCRQTKKRWGGV